MAYISPSAELRRRLRLHGGSVATVRIRHGVMLGITHPNAPRFGTGIRLLNAKGREIAKLLGWTLPTIMVAHILCEHFRTVSDNHDACGDAVDIRVAHYCHGESHTQD